MARAKKVNIRELAESIRQGIEQCADEFGVPEVFANAAGSPADKADAFWMLDEKPGMFPGYSYPNSTGWHSKLRRCRNSPDLGRKMFACFK